MSLFVYTLLVSTFLVTWLATISWFTRTPELQARHGATLGRLGTALGILCGLLGAGVGLWMGAS